MHWRRKWQPTPVFLPRESQGRRSLVGCRLWGHTESDMTEVTQQQQQQQQQQAMVHGAAKIRHKLKQLSMHACIGKGNGNPLQCSCLENPRDRRAWWAAVYGVTQSLTQLKRLSSSSSSSSRDQCKRQKTYMHDSPLSDSSYFAFPVINIGEKEIS